jgi:predicted RecB family endonuclease
MAGKATRNKGKEGERAAKRLLVERDWTIKADTTAGIATGDLIAESPTGAIYDIEVKNRIEINIRAFRGQAMKNAKKTKSRWMVLAKLDGERAWLVLRQGKQTTIWYEKGGCHEIDQM